jgi:hypothetical protein
MKNGLLLWILLFLLWLFSSLSLQAGNLYRVYFCSKGTGPAEARIEALNNAGAKAQIEAKYPGAYSIVIVQFPASAKK